MVSTDIPGLPPVLEGDVRHELFPAFQPGVRGNNPFMGSDNKYLVFQAPVLVLLHVPPLVEIAAVCPGEVGGVIDDCRSLALEKLIQFQIGLRVYRVAEQLGIQSSL